MIKFGHSAFEWKSDVKMIFSVAVVLFFLSQMLSNSTPKKFNRSSAFGDLGQRSLVSCLSTPSNDFYPELLGQFHLNFISSLME